MRTVKNSFLVSVLLVLCSTCLSLMAQNQEQRVTLNWGNVPKDFPLRLLNLDNAQIKDLADYEIRPLTFTLKNVSGKNVHVITIMSGCPCIVFNKRLENLTLKPNEEVTFKPSIFGLHLNTGAFKRPIYIEVEGQPLAQIACEGNVVDKVTFRPGRKYNLGVCDGNIPWKRSIKITSSFPNGQLELLPPEPDKLFDFKVTRLNQQDFQLDIAPKTLPLPQGRHFKRIAIPTRGIKNYGSLSLSFGIIVTNHKFTLLNHKISLKTADIPQGTKHTITMKIVYDRNLKLRKYHNYHAAKLYATKDIFSVPLPVSLDEAQKIPLTSRKTWELFAKDMSFKPVMTLPGITYELVPNMASVDVKITFPEDFFANHKHGKIFCPVLYKNRDINDIIIRW